MSNFLKVLSILIIGALIFSECSSVKTRTVKLTKTLDEQAKTEKSERSFANEHKKLNSKYRNRFEDTTVINVASDKNSQLEVPDKFNNALLLFDDGNYKEADTIFTEIIKTIETPNDKYYEIQFLIAECQIQFRDYPKAEEILKQLTEKSSTNHIVLEKSIVRLGQLYCIMDKKDLASGYFQRLKREFPKSEFMHFADCNFIK